MSVVETGPAGTVRVQTHKGTLCHRRAGTKALQCLLRLRAGFPYYLSHVAVGTMTHHCHSYIPLWGQTFVFVILPNIQQPIY